MLDHKAIFKQALSFSFRLQQNSRYRFSSLVVKDDNWIAVVSPNYCMCKEVKHNRYLSWIQFASFDEALQHYRYLVMEKYR